MKLFAVLSIVFASIAQGASTKPSMADTRWGVSNGASALCCTVRQMPKDLSRTDFAVPPLVVSLEREPVPGVARRTRAADEDGRALQVADAGLTGPWPRSSFCFQSSAANRLAFRSKLKR